MKATTIHNNAPRDGTVIAGVHNGIPTAPFEEPRQTHFDVNKLSWIGSISEDPFVGYVWHTSRVQTYDDAKKFEVVIGSASVNSMGSKMAILSNAWFGTKFKLVTGYEDSSTVKLALERGELEGTSAIPGETSKHSNPTGSGTRKCGSSFRTGITKIPTFQTFR